MNGSSESQGESYEPEVEAMSQRILSQAGVYRLRMERAAAAAAAEEAGEAPEEADLEKQTHAAHPGAPSCTTAHHSSEGADPPMDGAVEQNGAAGCAMERQGARRWPRMGPRRAAQNDQRPLEARQLMAARMLLSGRRVVDVAAALGVGRHTVTRWKKDPAFDREVRRMAVEMPMPEVSPPERERSRERSA